MTRGFCYTAFMIIDGRAIAKDILADVAGGGGERCPPRPQT